jgi:transmembrane sensor
MSQDVNNRYPDGRDSEDKDLEQKILDRSATFRIPPGKSEKEAFVLLKSRIAEENSKSYKPTKAIITRLSFRISAAAAACLLLFGTWFLLIRSHNIEVVADRGTHVDYRLPDGTQVKINAGSKIVYNKHDFLKSRNIVLHGEAFFDVVKGNTFHISTVHGDIEVLGTSFNVYSRDNLFKVSCISGRISISSENQSVEITPGESAIFRGKDLISYHDNNLNSSTSWIKGEFYYENSPLNLIFNEMERQFNIKFVTTKMKEKYFTGSFTNNDLENALDIVCIPMGLKYEIGNNGKILIREKTQ